MSSELFSMASFRHAHTCSLLDTHAESLQTHTHPHISLKTVMQGRRDSRGIRINTEQQFASLWCIVFGCDGFSGVKRVTCRMAWQTREGVRPGFQMTRVSWTALSLKALVLIWSVASGSKTNFYCWSKNPTNTSPKTQTHYQSRSLAS